MKLDTGRRSSSLRSLFFKKIGRRTATRTLPSLLRIKILSINWVILLNQEAWRRLELYKSYLLRPKRTRRSSKVPVHACVRRPFSGRVSSLKLLAVNWRCCPDNVFLFSLLTSWVILKSTADAAVCLVLWALKTCFYDPLLMPRSVSWGSSCVASRLSWVSRRREDSGILIKK